MTNKTNVKEIFAIYDRQIRKDMSFWIKHRPSRWGDFLPEKHLKSLINFIKSKGSKKLILISTLVFSLLFVGVIPTLNFIWSHIFRLWLIFLVIPLFYWVIAITSVYSRVVVQVICKFIRLVFLSFFKLINR